VKGPHCQDHGELGVTVAGATATTATRQHPDDADRAQADALIAGGLDVGATHTVMSTLDDRISLARFALGFAAPR
jgi:hypothetical protein